jgi:hypothetical protein
LIEAFYKGVQTFMEKLGDFLREVAALVLVFIPLDLWKESITFMRVAGVVGVAVILFMLGIGCEGLAIIVKRARDNYEEEASAQ